MPHTSVFILIIGLAMTGCELVPTPSKVKVSKQPAEGLTQSSFGQGFLEQLEEAVMQGAELSLKQAYERNNIPAVERISKPQVKGRYEWVGAHQLAVVDLSYNNNPMKVMRVVGIEADEIITINCISPTGTALGITTPQGECTDTIAKHFKLKLPD
jgi:hypothetical protein